MAKALTTASVLSWRNSHTLCHSPSQNGIPTTVAASASKNINRESEKLLVNRRTVLASGISLLGFPRESLAVVKQNLLAGRIPGLSEPDEQGLSLCLNLIRDYVC